MNQNEQPKKKKSQKQSKPSPNNNNNSSSNSNSNINKQKSNNVSSNFKSQATASNKKPNTSNNNQPTSNSISTNKQNPSKTNNNKGNEIRNVNYDDTKAVCRNYVRQIARFVRRNPNGQASLDQEIRAYRQLCTPDKHVLENRIKLIQNISRIINSTPSLTQKLPSGGAYEIRIFGSVGFNLDSPLSDLDLCIIDPDRPNGITSVEMMEGLPEIYDMRALAKALRAAGYPYQSIQPINNARIPILKIRSKAFNLSADLNTNGLLGCKNTQLLKAYSLIKPTVFRSLGLVIKLWAKCRNICDPSGNGGPASLSSYTLILMMIGFLQSRDLLPNLQSSVYLGGLVPRDFVYTAGPHIGGLLKVNTRASSNTGPSLRMKWEIERHDVTFLERPPSSWKPAPCPSLAALLQGFFDYYSSFDFENQIVSISNGRPERRQKPTPESPQTHPQAEQQSQQPRSQPKLPEHLESILRTPPLSPQSTPIMSPGPSPRLSPQHSPPLSSASPPQISPQQSPQSSEWTSGTWPPQSPGPELPIKNQNGDEHLEKNLFLSQTLSIIDPDFDLQSFDLNDELKSSTINEEGRRRIITIENENDDGEMDFVRVESILIEDKENNMMGSMEDRAENRVDVQRLNYVDDTDGLEGQSKERSRDLMSDIGEKLEKLRIEIAEKNAYRGERIIGLSDDEGTGIVLENRIDQGPQEEQIIPEIQVNKLNEFKAEPMVVKDPFILTRNTSRNVKVEMFSKIIKEIKRANKILNSGKSLVDLCNQG